MVPWLNLSVNAPYLDCDAAVETGILHLATGCPDEALNLLARAVVRAR